MIDRTGLRHSLRGLHRTPAFSIGVVATLGLALAASIAALTVVDRVLLRPLPLHEAERVVDLMESDGVGNRRLASWPTFEDWRRSSRVFAGLAFARGETMSLGERGSRQRAIVALVSSGFFRVAGIAPVAGRTFAPDEEATSGGGVVLISEAMWASQFGRDSSAIGRTMSVGEQPVTIIGVVGAAQRFPEWADIWMPLEPGITTSPQLQNRFLHVDSRVVGRLAAGATFESARDELAAVQRSLAAQHVDPGGAFPGAAVTPMRDAILGTTGGALRALGLGMVLVLLLACANVGGLVLLRMARREREFAVRAALGAPFRALVRQLVTESVILSLLAGALGTALAASVLGVVRSTPALGIPRASELAVDGRVAAVALVLSLVVGLVIGLLPAWRLRESVASGARFGRGASAGGERARRLRAAVTTLQLALALTLVIGAGLMLRSFDRMMRVDLGYRPEQVVAIDVHPPSPRYDDEDAARSLYRRLIDGVAAVPGIAAAGFVNHVPGGGWMPTRVTVPGVAPDPSGADDALYKTASESYAEIMGLRVVRGRWFSREDVDSRSTGVVVSEAVAKRFWPDQDPVGRALTVYRSSQARPGVGSPLPSTVIGVVAGVRHFGPAAAPAPEVYLPFTREPWGWGAIVVRSSMDEATLRRSIEKALLEVEPDLPLTDATGHGFRRLTEGVERFMAPRRVSTGLAAALAALALVVASLGLYALAAYGVAQRTGEFGVRMALGATPRAIVARVISDGFRLAAVGIALGLVGSLALGRRVSAQLFETSARDPLIIVAAALLLVGVLLVALWIPARRAARLDPVDALRAE